mgnify:CR=1 FL=1
MEAFHVGRDRIGADVAIGTVSLETRVDGGRHGDGSFFEKLGAVRSEVAYMLKHAPWRLPEIACRTVLKALGYRLGRRHQVLSQGMCSSLSMHKGYWA